MAKLNTRPAATTILDTDILLKDDTGSTVSEKVTGALLRAEILNGLNWVAQDSTAYSLMMGDRIVSNLLAATRVFDLPATFDITDTTNNIWVWNADSGTDVITLTPAAGDNLVVNGVDLTADVTFTIPKGVMVCIIPNVADTTWNVITFGLVAGEGTVVNGNALDLDVNSLTTETTVDTAADFFPFWDAGANEHKKISMDNIHAGILNGLNWAVQDSTAYSLMMGDRIVSNLLAATRVFDLPATFNITDDINDIWVWNSDSGADVITLTPAAGDNLVVNGVDLTADVTFTIPKGVVVCIVPKVTSATWGVITFGVTTGEGTVTNGSALDLDVNSLTTETTIDVAADYIPFWDADATEHKKIATDSLRAGILNGLNWVPQDSTAYSLMMGDRIVANLLAATRIFDLPATFNVTDDTNNIWVWNSDSGADVITLTPAAGDNLVVNGVDLTADVTFTIPKGVMVCIVPKVTDATWGVITFGLVAGEGTVVNGNALDLDVNSLTTETTVDGAADFIAFWDADATEHKKIAFDNIPGAGGSVQIGWTFDTTLTSSDPGSKTFRYDNATQASVTEIYVDDIAEGGFDASAILGALKDGDTIFIQDLKSADNSAVWTLTATPTDNTGWWTLPVTLDAEGALGLPSNNVKCGWLILAGTSSTQSSPKQSITLGAAATTFAVTSSFAVITGDAGTNTVATITGGYEGQTLALLFEDALVTITDDNAQTADSVDLSAAFTSADDTTLTLIYDGTSWYELSRSVN